MFFLYASVCFIVLLFCIWWVYGACSIVDVLHASPSGEEPSMSNGVWNFWADGSPITRLKHQPLSTCFWMVLLMDEIRNNHQRCIKPVNYGIDNCTNLKWCGISSINSMFMFFVLVFSGLSMFHIVSFLYTLYIRMYIYRCNMCIYNYLYIYYICTCKLNAYIFIYKYIYIQICTYEYVCTYKVLHITHSARTLGGFCKSCKVQIHQCLTISPPPPAIWDTWSWLASDVEILVIHAQGWTWIDYPLVDMKCKSLHTIRMRIWPVVAQKELDFINVDPIGPWSWNPYLFTLWGCSINLQEE